MFVSLSAGVIGGFFTSPSIPAWYASLAKPYFNPPNWVFGPVWTILYILMGVAFFLVWRKSGRREGKDGRKSKYFNTAAALFGIQLALNALWSIVFFGMHSIGGALAVIGLLWLAILANIVWFWRSSRAAALLLVPYIAWVSFASFLNYVIWTLN